MLIYIYDSLQICGQFFKNFYEIFTKIIQFEIALIQKLDLFLDFIENTIDSFGIIIFQNIVSIDEQIICFQSVNRNFLRLYVKGTMKSATAAYLEYAELNNPLKSEEESLITQMIKRCFVSQVRTWALCQRPNRRKQLFDFLSGKDPKKSTRPMTSFSRNENIVIQSSTCRIDLTANLDLTPKPTRRCNVNRFKSDGIIGEKIFGDCKAINRTTPLQTENNSLAQFILKKLIRPEKVNLLINKAEDYFLFLQELNQFIEKKSNILPIDEISEHPSLNPNKERVANLTRNREDHIAREGFPPKPHDVKARTRTVSHPWRTPTTSYTDFFSSDPRYNQYAISSAYSPLDNPVPFSRFPQSSPEDMERRSQRFDPKFLKQVKEDSITNRTFKKIFNSKTVL